MTSSDILFMRRALELARLGRGKTKTNPLVGCLIVHEGRIIGEGWHQEFGGPHAEVNAIAAVPDQELLPGSRLYVTLEPCSHYGKTPPCADLLIQNKIRDVVICNTDPNPLVQGAGIRRLLAAGARVHTGLLENEGRELNKAFFTFHSQQRPYITLKWAETRDGFIGRLDGEKLQISSPLANKLTHQWRSGQQALMVATRTAAADNPQLNTRDWTGPDPVRVVLDRHLTLPGNLQVMNQQQPTLIYNLHRQETLLNLEWVKLPDTAELLPAILADLTHRGIQSVLIEGGAVLLNSFLQAGLWDEALVWKSRQKLEREGVAAPNISFSGLHEMHQVGPDSLFIYKNHDFGRSRDLKQQIKWQKRCM